MKVSHYFNQQNQISKEVIEEPSFLLTNQLGGYLWLAKEPESRYQGWFFSNAQFAGKKVFKLLENISLLSNNNPITGLTNNFWNVQRSRGKLQETFFLPAFFNSLVYQVNFPADLEIVLDIKETYDNQEVGRAYQMEQSGKNVLISFHRPAINQPDIFLAIKIDNGSLTKKEEWFYRKYPLDQSRHSQPFGRYVFKALEAKGASKIVFSVAFSAKEARAEVEYVFSHMPLLEKQNQKRISSLKPNTKIKDIESRMAELCAQNSLESLLIYDGQDSHKKVLGLSAGLPWLFQFWLRDEAISLKALFNLKVRPAKAIILKLARGLSQKEWPDYIDSFGFVWQRAQLLLKSKKLFFQEIQSLKKFLSVSLAKTAIDLLEEDDLIRHSPTATWMDSITRPEATIEGQACFLNLLDYLKNASLSKKQKNYYSQLLEKLQSQTRKYLWNGQVLADGFDPALKATDFTIRPNLFLAAYLYSALLTKEEWQKCFDSALEELWLAWGGLSTLAQSRFDFQNWHTGENPVSYHQGDSWFWINNLVALILEKNNPQHFANQIKQIFRASVSEILWQGAIGHHAELSSAQQLTSQGCPAQAWSSAMFLELCCQLYKA